MFLKPLLNVVRRYPEREQIFHWYVEEVKYADSKFGDQRQLHDLYLFDQSLSDDSFWFRQIFQYIDRARIFGLDSLAGRQALAKSLMTMIGCLESTIRVHGDLPKPGVPSGEVNEWVGTYDIT